MMDTHTFTQEEKRLEGFMKDKPRLFKRNGLWFARIGDRMTVGHTPMAAYKTLMWRYTDGVYG